VRLARELRLPLLSRDTFKEALMNSLGSPDRARSRELGRASYTVLFAALDQVLAAGVGAVLESNFGHGLAEGELRPLAVQARIVQLHCRIPHDEIRRRYVARAETGERHPGHHDSHPETLADLDANLASDRHLPLDLDAPLLEIDTTAGYRPEFAAILAFIAAGTRRRDV
jgi:predicted kinase